MGMAKKSRLSGGKLSCEPEARLKRGRTFRKSNDGTAAIEFALCAPVFFMMCFGIFEVGLNYLADRLLNTGIDNAARLIKTGQVRASPTYGMAEFKQQVCDEPIMFLFDCNNLIIDVQTVGSFEENNYETNEDGSVDTSSFGFAPGGRTTINVVRAFYEWPTIINWKNFGQAHGYDIDSFGEGSRVIAASAAFMNEPFNGGPGG